ncbi:ABC transporter permease subunit [Terribacillus sp. AE2B 122]|uniref:ABC transporter permease subunit n=1 Tax=Terribacillus sp. AE2B 122 TaxID=1331902 RepID=UPI001440CB38|nr:ABC transporter permease subunit [Terribacillus sp. AE2B 122]VVM34053.1 Oligopeptide transport system permease protein OppB (TC 3.A.1.5.1) [Terribacillus sp. AE2B 122]
MARLIIRETYKLVVLFISILLISIIPFFVSPEGLQLPSIDDLTEFLTELFTFDNLTYINSISGVERELFPLILDAFLSTFTVFFSSLFLSVCLALAIAVLQIFLPRSLRKTITSISTLLQSIPDIVYVLFSQLLVIIIFRFTDSILFKFTGSGDDEALFLPIITLSLMPTIYLYRTLVLNIEQEISKTYVELARSKGLSRFAIIMRHVMRNILADFVYQLKFIMGLLIGNLFIVEVLFNNFGLTTFLLSFSQPTVFAVSSVLLFLPIYVVIKSLEISLYIYTGKELDL